MKHTMLILGFMVLWPGPLWAENDAQFFLTKPAINLTHVVFVCGGDLWSVHRQGGDATRLTSGAGIETDPVFSPDGTQLAFTGEYEGNLDVYVMPAGGGLPRRLTYHPGADQVVGWTPDGKNVLFRSTRNSSSRFSRLFTVSLAGGLPSEVPLPMAYEASYAPDGKHLAYVPLPPAFTIWKRYRGGLTSSISVANLADSRVEKLPRENSNDFNPMWVGNKIYFLSDRAGPITVFAYDPATKKATQLLTNDGLDIKSASAASDALVYDQFGELHVFDLATGKARKLAIRVPTDLPTIRPRFVKAAKYIHNADISPSGARAVFEARGEILTVPAEKGDPRNLTNTPAVCERSPRWSPDGKAIAYLSDESGEYQLHVREARGFSEPKTYDLGKAPSFYFSPTWSPDGKKILYTDKRLNLWTLDLASRQNTLVDTDYYDDMALDPVWSPDSRWIAYTKQLPSHLHAVYLYSLATGKAHQVTDGMSDVRYAAFDRSGKYLYFTASTDAGAALGWEMSSIGRPVTRSVYALVLRDDLPSPVAPESDEEKAEEKDKGNDPKEKKEKPGDVEPLRIDLEDWAARTIALPIPAKNYMGLLVGKEGIVYLLEGGPSPLELPIVNEGPPQRTLHKFDLEKRKVEKLLDNVRDVHIAHRGDKLLYRQGDGWFITDAAHPKAGEGSLNVAALEVRVDPRAEWKQMYHEAWRLERDFLYTPTFHGLDLQTTEKKYAPYLSRLTTRSDLNYLFSEMLGELTLGHVYILGGDAPQVTKVPGGLLGADYQVQKDRYRFARIYSGGSWDPHLKAPLAQPGVRVKAGDYLLAVNGRELKAPETPYQALEGTAGKSVSLKIGSSADGKDARTVTVVPVGDEAALRNAAWIDDNRRTVDELSGGQIAYVYVPDTMFGGYASFVRTFFPQVGKEAVIIDERFNSGGIVPDYVVDTLRRPLIGYVSTREGADSTLPYGAIFGPKAMLINEKAGSGGDELPHYFRATKAGPLIGKRTWGGLVGIGDYPPLMDGGMVTAPNAAFWFPSGDWEVENRGVAPDIEVEYDPYVVRKGHDPQLEKAVSFLLEELKKNPLPKKKRPPYPNYHEGKSPKQTKAPSSSPAGK
ncbi:MAG: PDZ domain-containing protein [Gemmataceae bacterium]